MIIGSFAADHVIRSVRLFDWAVQQAVAVAARGLHLHDRHPALRAGGRIRLHQEGRRARRRRGAGGGLRGALRREARPRHGARVRDGPVLPLERRHVHLARRRAAARRSPRTSPSCTPGSWSSPRSGTTARPAARSSTGSGRRSRRSRSTTRWPSPPRTKGRLAVIPGHFDWDDVGDFASLAKLNSHGRKQRPRDPRRERARALGCLQRHRRQPDPRVISLIGVQGHRRRRHRGRPAGHDERARAAGEGRGGCPQAHRPGRRALIARRHGRRGIRMSALLRLCNHCRRRGRSGMQTRASQ